MDHTRDSCFKSGLTAGICVSNPPQFAAAAALAAAHPGVRVAINHLGTPTLACLKDEATAAVYWSGMTAFAALPHVFVKLSMLQYTDAFSCCSYPRRRELL